MLIGEVANAAGMTTQAIRFYERKCLLPHADSLAEDKPVVHVEGEIDALTVAQTAGPTLAEIRSIIDLRDKGSVPCGHVATLLESKLADVRARMRHLAALQVELEALLEHGNRLDPANCTDDDICHILSTST